jgi:hypothetical protein
MLRGSLVIPDDATQPTTPYLIRKNDKVVLDRPTDRVPQIEARPTEVNLFSLWYYLARANAKSNSTS